MNEKQSWYVIFTKQQCEKKVLTALSRRGYQCYCPTHTQNVQWKNQDRTTEKLLFNSYVFIRCAAHQFPDIKRTPGVINFLYRLDQPAMVTNEDMSAIVHAVNHYDDIRILKTSLNAPVPYVHEESETFSYPLASLGFTLVAAKEKVLTGAQLLDEEPRRTLQRLSLRFRLAWR